MAKKSKHRKNQTVSGLLHKRDSAFRRFPLLFTLLGAFGAAVTFAGLSGIVEQIPLLANNPYIALTTGMLILVLTGKLYKKLG